MPRHRGRRGEIEDDFRLIKSRGEISRLVSWSKHIADEGLYLRVLDRVSQRRCHILSLREAQAPTEQRMSCQVVGQKHIVINKRP